MPLASSRLRLRRNGPTWRVLDQSSNVLRQWLVIQLYVVAMNAFFAGVALWAFGVPAPLALATISGALAFIPYFGSIIALIVGGLVALPHGLESAALAALAIGSRFRRRVSDNALPPKPLAYGAASRAAILDAGLRLTLWGNGRGARGAGNGRFGHCLRCLQEAR